MVDVYSGAIQRKHEMNMLASFPFSYQAYSRKDNICLLKSILFLYKIAYIIYGIYMSYIFYDIL